MAISPPIFQQNSSYSARVARQLVALVGTEGVIGSGFAVTERGAGANMSIDVEAGQAFVEGTDESGQGTYLLVSDTVVNLAVDAADPTNPRIDGVFLTVRDPDAGGQAGDDWVIEVVAGTPAVSPDAPALPGSALRIANVAVGAGVTSIVNANVTDTRGARATATLAPSPIGLIIALGG